MDIPVGHDTLIYCNKIYTYHLFYVIKTNMNKMLDTFKEMLFLGY